MFRWSGRQYNDDDYDNDRHKIAWTLVRLLDSRGLANIYVRFTLFGYNGMARNLTRVQGNNAKPDLSKK